MDGTYEGWLQSAWAQCWQVTLLILAVWITVRLVARNRPHLACVLWLVVLIKCVTPPLWSSPSSVFSWLQVRNRVAEASVSRPAWELARSMTNDGNHSDPADVVVQISRTNADQGAPLPSDTQLDSSSLFSYWFSSSGSSPWIGILVGIWSVGCVAFASLAALRWARCWQRLRRAGEVDAPEVIRLVERLRQRVGLRRPVRLMVSRSPVGPAVVGIFRPIIILPALIVESKTPAELEPLLAHELIHIKRGDLWTGLLQLLAQGVWWFHPLVRLANSLLTREAERCCDEEVIAQLGCEPGQYARGLIDVLALKRTLQPVPVFPGVRPVDVTSQRLERIMRLGQGCHKRTPRWCWVLMLLAVAGTLPGAALIVAEDESQPDAATVANLVTDEDANTADNTTPDEQVQVITDGVNLLIDGATTTDISARKLEIRGFEVEENKSTSVTKMPSITVVYNGDEVIQRMRSDLNLSDEEARKMLIDMLTQQEKAWVSKRSEEASLSGRSKDWQDKLANAPELRLRFDKHQLVIMYSESGYRRVVDHLQSLHENGFQQLVIETRVMSGPLANTATIPVDWKVLDLGMVEADPETRPDEFPARDKAVAPTQTDNRIHGRVESFIEKHHPAMLALVDQPLIQQIVNTAQSNPRTNILWAPKITLFNGQTATIEDTLRRPFITGFQHTAGKNTPVVRVCEEGWLLRCRPKLQDGSDTVQLDLNLTLREILNVENTTLPGTKQRPALTVQVPELGTTRIRTDVKMRLGQTLVIGGLRNRVEARNAGVPPKVVPTYEPFMVLVQIKKLPPVERKDPVQASASQATPNPVVNVTGIAVEEEDSIVGVLQAEPAPPAARKASEPHTRGSYDPAPPNAEPVLETRVYNVADLVIPIETSPSVIIGEDPQILLQSEEHQPREADFATLVKLITTTIEPKSWKENGGLASVRKVEPTLSLVVQQTEAGHHQIADLFTQLRSLQNLQASLELERVEISMNRFKTWAAKESDKQTRELPSVLENLPVPAAGIIRHAVEVLRRADGVTFERAPKITLFNGQPAELKSSATLPDAEENLKALIMMPIVSADLRLIRLNLTAILRTEGKTRVKKTELITLPRGAPALIDLSVANWMESSLGRPAETKPVAPMPDRRHFYLITPRAILVQEAEQLTPPEADKANNIGIEKP